MIHVVIKYKGDPKPEVAAFDHGTQFTTENINKEDVEWLYFAMSEADAKVAAENLTREKNI